MTLPSIQQLIDAQKAIDAARDLINEVRKENQDLAETQIEITKRLVEEFGLTNHDDFRYLRLYSSFRVLCEEKGSTIWIEFFYRDGDYITSIQLRPSICSGLFELFEFLFRKELEELRVKQDESNQQSRERKIQYLQDQLRMLTNES